MPPLKPPARARRVPALRRRQGATALTTQAIEALFGTADVMTEGSADGARFFGSTLITFDLARLRQVVRGLDEAEDLDQFVELLMGSVQVRVRAHRTACREVYARFPDREVGTAQIESRFRREGERVLLDIDLEAPLDVSSAERAT